MLSLASVRNLNKESLFEFLSFKTPEGSQLDYKQSFSNRKEEAYREFLKDITAFANAHGGLLILGVKEPSKALSPEAQVTGIIDGESVAKDLERVAADSVDPRIPGLLIKLVHIENDKHVIVVFIPPSLVRPHMVNYQKHRSFYIRHSESSVPMSTYEIRDVVLSSATNEGRARAYAQEEEIEALEYIEERPAFLIQAVPLLTLESPWAVLDKPIEEIAKGKNRVDRQNRENRYAQTYFSLVTAIESRPTVKGVLTQGGRNDDSWITEISRSGYVQTIYWDIRPTTFDASIVELNGNYMGLFQAFCDLCVELWEATQTDIPYLFRCKYCNAQQTVFRKDKNFDLYIDVDGKRVIMLPEQVRQTGETIEQVPRIWVERLYNAFGERLPVPGTL